MRQEEKPAADPTPDPQLQAALRSLGDEPPLEAVDWERLRTSVREGAALRLARRRRGAERRWSRLRPFLPLAAAASIALAVWVGTGAGEGEPATAPAAGLSAEELLRDDLDDQEFRRLVSGEDDPAALLLLALDEG